MAPVGDNVCACVCVGFVNRALTACLVKASFNNPHMKQPGWRWIRAGRASLEDRPSLLVNGGCLAYASQSDWAHAQLLAVRLPRPHRALAQAIGRWPQVASGACPGRTGVHPRYLFTLRWLGADPIAMARRRPRPHRELSRYLCKLRDWAQAQSYAAGLPAVCHKWSGALPPLAYATTRHTPRLGALPSLRWQRKRLPCQPHLAIIYAISNGWSDPMASILPKYRKYIIALTTTSLRYVLLPCYAKCSIR